MDKLKNYKIKFAGLKNGKHDFVFEIKQTFFQLFGDAEQEFDHADLQAEVQLIKHENFLEVSLSISGSVQLICDISGESFNHPLSTGIKVQVNFGDHYDDQDDEIITLPQHETEFSIAQLVYEAVNLAIPMKKVAPNISNETLELLEKYSPEHQKENNSIDPRWEALNKLKSKNK